MEAKNGTYLKDLRKSTSYLKDVGKTPVSAINSYYIIEYGNVDIKNGVPYGEMIMFKELIISKDDIELKNLRTLTQKMKIAGHHIDTEEGTEIAREMLENIFISREE